MSYVTKDKNITKVIKVTEDKKASTDINTYEYSDLLKNSFHITYVLLLTTATITIIEALRTSDPHVRHILNLETCISIIAGYFYSVFNVKVADYKDKSFNWVAITRIRYIDWSVTTPLMLLALCLVLSMNTNNKNSSINVFKYLIIVILNYLMLILGYLGEIGKINRFMACILGFIPFFVMFYYIYINYVNVPKSNSANYVLFTVYIIIWSMYGIVFLLPEETKNTITNFLDLTAKCFVGLGLWAYYTGVISC